MDSLRSINFIAFHLCPKHRKSQKLFRNLQRSWLPINNLVKQRKNQSISLAERIHLTTITLTFHLFGKLSNLPNLGTVGVQSFGLKLWNKKIEKNRKPNQSIPIFAPFDRLQSQVQLDKRRRSRRTNRLISAR